LLQPAGDGRLHGGSAASSTLRLPNRILNIQALFERHHDELYRYAFRLTGDADLAADIAQETFIRWIEREPENSEARAWLFKVATNLCRDHVRVHSRRLVLLRESPESVPVGDAPLDPERSLEVAERRAFARDALRALPEKEQTMLLMQQEGFSHKEIADTVGTTTGSVGTMLARALRRFAGEIASKREAL
jgi:RNA polymerase sigma-70 factor, ECF subfamily